MLSWANFSNFWVSLSYFCSQCLLVWLGWICESAPSITWSWLWESMYSRIMLSCNIVLWMCSEPSVWLMAASYFNDNLKFKGSFEFLCCSSIYFLISSMHIAFVYNFSSYKTCKSTIWWWSLWKTLASFTFTLVATWINLSSSLWCSWVWLNFSSSYYLIVLAFLNIKLLLAKFSFKSS